MTMRKSCKLPKWRLKANFLLRELTRLWYGKKSVFTLVKGDKEQESFWRIFGFIWGAMVIEFGKTHGIATDEMDKRIKSIYKEYAKLSDKEVGFDSPFHPIVWFALHVLGDTLGNKFLYDFQVDEILVLAAGARFYAIQGKMPPYVKDTRTPQIEFYENLPVATELEKLFYGNPSPKS
jgi:hypothetical protein